MSVITHVPFEPLKEGVFDIPHELYHDHIKAPEVNRGIIVEMASKSPAHVRSMIDRCSTKKPTKAMVSGLLVDLCLLEPDKFKEGVTHWVRPDGLNLATKDGIKWKSEHPSLPYIHQKTDSPLEASAEDIQGIIESVMRHRLARRIVESSVKQESAFCFCPDTGIMRKCRPDTRLADNSGRLTLADLKTTMRGGTTLSALSRHCAQMSYHLQSVFYGDIYKDLLGEDPFFVFFIVERKPPYAVRVFQIHQEGLEVARTEYKRALERFAQCKQTGGWPQYEERIEVIKLPRWILEPKDEE